MRKDELTGKHSDNWKGRRGKARTVVGFMDIVGALAFISDVQIAQVQLMALGYNVGSAGADGKLGANTAAALKSFQQKEGLQATGTLDDATKKRLYERTALMNLKLPNGNPIVVPTITQPAIPQTQAPSNTAPTLAVPSPLPGVELTPTFGFPTAPAPAPTVDWSQVPGMAAPQPAPTAPVEEKKYFGLTGKQAVVVSGITVAGIIAAALAYYKATQTPAFR